MAIERWGFFETTFHADVSAVANPFVDVSLRVTLKGPEGYSVFDGFYDGGDTFKVRYMPQTEGHYALTVQSNLPGLNGQTAEFDVTAPSADNHGPVVVDGMHFRYADGKRFFVMGTTAYVWHYRPAEIRAKTLDTFTKFGFNKIRMLFFPKHYTGQTSGLDVSYEPPCYPFMGEPKHFDFRRPNPAYFAAFEDRLREMQEREIIADVILFHPYDFGQWDIDYGMNEDDVLHYLRYIVARLSAFRNVWWSLANEYDIKMLPDRSGMVIDWDRRDWDVIGEFVKARDPAHHPISCHNIPFGRIYPDRPWMTHVSYQHPDTYTLMLELQNQYHKPVINDEYQYEGNISDDWGSCDGAQELERHWRSVMAGGYATHGEAMIIGDNRKDIFWSYGGEMVGESAPRLRYLRQLVESVPFEELEREYLNSDSQHYYTLHKGTDFYMVFMRDELPRKSLWIGEWGPGRKDWQYDCTVYDVWNCKEVRHEILPPSCRVPFTAWTVVILKKIPAAKEA